MFSIYLFLGFSATFLNFCFQLLIIAVFLLFCRVPEHKTDKQTKKEVSQRNGGIITEGKRED